MNTSEYLVWGAISAVLGGLIGATLLATYSGLSAWAQPGVAGLALGAMFAGLIGVAGAWWNRREDRKQNELAYRRDVLYQLDASMSRAHSTSLRLGRYLYKLKELKMKKEQLRDFSLMLQGAVEKGYTSSDMLHERVSIFARQYENVLDQLLIDALYMQRGKRLSMKDRTDRMQKLEIVLYNAVKIGSVILDAREKK